ncbi:MAG: helix-hairpin-helix domain-containing protein [Chitinophagaceae bacterium]|nr:helix-hairpin-helix domain-containing protein [Chitinophagaceae bacterium]
MLKNFLRSYLNYTRKERTGILVLTALILFFSGLPFFYPLFISPTETDPAELEKAFDGFPVQENDSLTDDRNKDPYQKNRYRSYGQEDHPAPVFNGTLFSFDPNTLSAEGWKKLGIRDKTIKTILNYISKGGRFRQPGDIGKIWGLHRDEIQRLMPYVNIPQQETEPKRVFEKTERKAVMLKTFDINKADTSSFIALPGIGSKLASRIIAFREKLGGFYRIEQVAETFALPDSTFQKIRNYLLVNDPAVKQLNINSATADELKQHPYIRYNLARAIVEYRNQHGNFSALSELKKIILVTDELFLKLSPYLTIR